jgi:hypothetical protein
MRVDSLPGRSRMPSIAPGLGAVVALAGALLVQSACLREETAQGSARSIDRTTQALSGGGLLSANGTYGVDCQDRSGSWSVAVDISAVLDHPELSVVTDDVACQLTLTELHSTSGIITAAPTILLSTSYQATPSVFGSPVDFYANAMLSSLLFEGDFVLSILYSDDPRLAGAENTAVAVPPTVIANTPPAGAVDTSIGTRPTATFSSTMAPATITNLTFTLFTGPTPVPASVTYDVATRTATLTPDSVLDRDSLYEVRVTDGVVDTRGTPLAADFVWTFTTAVCSQGPVDLGAASSFAVLAATTVTSAGVSTVVGDLGVTPGTAVTGFPPGTVTGGAIHTSDATVLAAGQDRAIAYSDAATRSVCPNDVAAEIGGTVMHPGLYRSTTFTIATGDLTLDAQGDVDAVFVFQAETTVNIGAGYQVLLINGARSANIYWKIGSSATLLTNSYFVGTILANVSITVGAGVELDGRLFANTGAVTLDTNRVVVPAP